MRRLRAWYARLPGARRWLVRVPLAWAGLVLAAVVALLIAAALQPLPPALAAGERSVSLRLYDRSGRLQRELRTSAHRSALPVRLDELSPHVVPALLAVEDSRFRWHPGVDPLAIARAAWQALAARRVVSGASTLTQQLARSLVPRPRSLFGKLGEMALALRIEAALDKDRILLEYLNRIEFGPNQVGIEAASRHYFDKPAKALDLAETATLIALVRGPSLYDPRRNPERLLARRAFVLERLRSEGGAEEAAIALAERAELRVHGPELSLGPLHAAFGLSSGTLIPELRGQRPSAIRTSLDAGLQTEVEAIARRAAAGLTDFGASALALLVVDNATSQVTAYVGSQDYFAEAALGANDGTIALRQPGSALKPFVYAAAMERLGWTGATLLPDLALSLRTPHGEYAPENYDGRLHGPVRLRVALGSSLNLPAVYAAQAIGPQSVLDLLHRAGFASLDRGAGHYGVAIALGDGEVRLSELAAAYAALARDGVWRPLRYALSAELASGGHVELPEPPSRRVISATVARQITAMLADDAARSPTFGAGGVLSFPFPAAAKTGTSKGFRDNWAIAYTREATVAVWVGNFDGRPMVRSSGVTGAGPVLHEALLAVMRGRVPAPLIARDGLVAREICALSGELPSPACSERVREHFPRDRQPASECGMHVFVAVDPENGLRATPDCPHAELRAFERYPERYASWAEAAHRPLAPAESSSRCGRSH